MRSQTFILAFGVSAGFAGGASATTLDSATAAALAASPGLDSARADYLTNAARVGIAVARARPQVRFSANVTHDFDNDPFTPRIRNETSVRLTVPLYSGGRIRSVIAAARLRSIAAEDDVEMAADDLRISVAESYDRLLDAEDGVRIAHDEVVALDRHFTMISKERSEGAATRTDQDQVAGRLSSLRARLANLNGEREAARTAYRQVVGVDPDRLVEPEVPVVTADLQQLTDSAVRSSPSLHAFEARIDAATRDVAASRGAGRPSLSFVASASYGNTDMRLAESRRFPQRLFAQAGITLTIPLYSGGQVAAQTARAKAALREAEAEAEVERRGLVAEIRTDYASYKGALQQIAAADAASDASRRALEGVRIEHGAGTRSALDLLNAQREAFANARAAARARRQAHLRAVALLVRTHIYLTTGNDRGEAAPMPRHDPAALAAIVHVRFDLGNLPGSARA